MSEITPPIEWMATMGRGARVLVIDSGYDFDDPFVVPVGTRSFTDDGSLGSPDHHGTLVAKIIASRNPVGLGVAPLCDLYVAKAINRFQRWDSMFKPLEWAMELGVDVVNMSLVFAEFHEGLAHRLDALDRHGVIVTAAYNPHKAFPHSLPSVIAVGGQMAPGIDLATSPIAHPSIITPAGTVFSGTSVSSAKVAGIAACAKACNRNMNRQQFLAAIGRQ